jgi:uncharacterized phage protein (TIGR02218 family)
MAGDADLDGADVTVVGYAPTSGRLDGADAAIVGFPLLDARLDGADVAVLGYPDTLGRLDGADVAVVAFLGPAATQRTDLLTITRTDGMELRFTSLDEDYTWGLQTWRHCASFQDSAAESSSELGSVGSTSLIGVIEDDAISDVDIYAGKWDDAFVELWVVDRETPFPSPPFRDWAGWIGKISFGQSTYSAEVIGPGHKLQQTGLVDFFGPGCRWDFGVLDFSRDPNGIGCPVDVPSLTIRNARVTGSKGRGLMFFDCPTPGGTALWNLGKVKFTYGVNAGVVLQVNTVDFGAQALSLWDLLPFPPEPGDLFDLEPGCPKNKPACQDNYDVYESYGGFPDTPGPDALRSNADDLFK